MKMLMECIQKSNETMEKVVHEVQKIGEKRSVAPVSSPEHNCMSYTCFLA
jgi:hypothetical protein